MHAQALHEIVSCLLDSAVQRTPRGGRVWVDAGREGGNRITVSITDSGLEMAQRLNKVLSDSHASSSGQVRSKTCLLCPSAGAQFGFFNYFF